MRLALGVWRFARKTIVLRTNLMRTDSNYYEPAIAMQRTSAKRQTPNEQR
jgi:hypothetical protein